MASGHDAHDDHGHDDHHDDGHGDTSSLWVVPPIVVGMIIAIVIIVLLGTASTAPAWHSPFS